MTFPVLLLLVLLSAGAAGMGWWRAAWVLGVVTLVLALGIGCGPVPAWLARGLQAGYPAQPPDRWAGRTAIVLLGGGDERLPGGAVETSLLAYGRLVKALEVYRMCRQRGGDCFILATGGDPRQQGASEASVFGAQLRQLGVAEADLLLEEKSLNTWQNARFSAPLLTARRPGRVLLVTSGLHLRRALLYFKSFGVDASPVRGDYVNALISPVPLAWNFLLTDQAVHEHLGILRHRIWNALGWNVTAAGAGAL